MRKSHKHLRTLDCNKYYNECVDKSLKWQGTRLEKAIQVKYK